MHQPIRYHSVTGLSPARLEEVDTILASQLEELNSADVIAETSMAGMTSSQHASSDAIANHGSGAVGRTMSQAEIDSNLRGWVEYRGALLSSVRKNPDKEYRWGQNRAA